MSDPRGSERREDEALDPEDLPVADDEDDELLPDDDRPVPLDPDDAEIA